MENDDRCPHCDYNDRCNLAPNSAKCRAARKAADVERLACGKPAGDCNNCGDCEEETC